MEENYIKLLVDGCLKLTKNDALFISYDKINHDFIMRKVLKIFILMPLIFFKYTIF